ncbi:type III PLP-dependent enzyme [Paenibacillus tundrae]|uniref:type III PLP-dependent enzyme n=1 Tax=Paenibacillus tundrae TaxID=528187 RepID=UPI0030D53A4E
MISKVETVIRQIQEGSEEPVCAYLYDLAGIQEQVSQMLQHMPQHTSLFYAIKANPDPRIIEALLPWVKGFEVASIGELLKVRRISAQVPILFGGPGKKEAELEQALEHQVTLLHVESLLELRRLIAIAKRKKKVASILLRINLRSSTLPRTKIVMGGGPSPFGLDEEWIEQAIQIIREEGAGAVHLRGFHFHSLSNNTDARLHAEMIELYLNKVQAWRDAYGIQVEVVNAGGGFGVTYDGSPGFDWPLFTSLLNQSEARKRLDGVQLYFEPGRILVADHGYYATEVTDIKVSHGEQFAVIRGGTHHNRLPASWGHNHPFHVMATEHWAHSYARPEVKHNKVHIVGELCTPKDRMHSNAEVELLHVGDIVVFEKSGAYCWTISHHDFLGHPHPAFHYLTEGNNHVNSDEAFQSASR